ncbi:MAG: serine/threonine protein phosphatase, partial [Limosilactobacillus sp.]
NNSGFDAFVNTLITIIGVFCVAASLKSSTYLYHTSASRKIQINYQDGGHKTLFSEYYDVRPSNRNYANFFGGKESFWQKNRSFKNAAYYYGQNQHGYHRLWKESNGQPQAKYLMIQHVKRDANTVVIQKQNPQTTIRLISSQKDPMKFIDQYRDHGRCRFPNEPQIRYYQLNTLTQY